MRSFGVEKFKSLVLAGSFTVLANYFVRLSDSVVAGNMLGPDALAGINLVAPILASVSFLSGLVSTGMATNYSLAMGRCERTRARQYFMQALWLVLGIGGAVSLSVLFGRGAFLSFMGASPTVSGFAADYLSWSWATIVPECLVGLLIMLGYADGDAKLCTTAYAVNFVVNLGVSILAVWQGMGAAGCAFATLCADIASIAVLVAHFFRPCNTFAPVGHFSFGDTWRIVAASFGDAAAFLCDGLLFFFLNKFVILRFGSEVLPIVGVATALWGFLEFFNGIGVAVQPIVTVYYGEGNMKSVRTVMNAAMLVAVLEGAAFMAFFGLFPELVCSLVGIREPALVAQGVFAIRCMCGGFVALAFAGLFNSYYMFVERPVLAGAVTFLCYLIMPVACVASGSLFGVGGVWAGLGLGPFAGILVAAAFVVPSVGWKAFPLLLPRDRDGKVHVFDLRFTDEEIVATSQKVGSLPGVPMRAALMTEEVFMTVKDRNRGRKVIGEAVVDLNDGVQLTLRDDGEIFDITDADAEISSLRTFLVASVMERQTGRLNLVTTGFNRNVFRF